MAIKWQDILKYGGTGSVSLFFLLALVLNLSGMSYSHDGDKYCVNECFSEIKINSSYWQINVEHSGNKPVVYKKNINSRTLWINLDKINEVVTTNPNIKVNILVPTNSKYSTMKHPEYGYLRPLKDGDVLIKRQTKSDPSSSRIILQGFKNSYQEVKWTFAFDSYYHEKVDIDPKWKSGKQFLNGSVEKVYERRLDIKNINNYQVIEGDYQNISLEQYKVYCFMNATDVFMCRFLEDDGSYWMMNKSSNKMFSSGPQSKKMTYIGGLLT